jgi:ferredoxin-NADP reductase
MTAHPLAQLFHGVQAVEAEIARREGEDPGRDAADVLTIERYHPKRIALIVSEIICETESANTFRVRHRDGAQLPPFLAGQYVNVYVDVATSRTSRPFAISSSPSDASAWDLTVRRVHGGRVSNHLIDHVKAGDHLSSTGPMGSFHHNPLFHGDDVAFLAGGSGVAPAMSMIRDIIDHDLPRRLHLIYGSRSESDVIFKRQLDHISRLDPRITVDHVILDPEPGSPGRSGLITAETITALAGRLAGRMVYVCGPQAMYPHALGQLAELGHPRRRIRFEANGAPTRPEAQPGWPAHLDPRHEVTVSVRGGPTFRSARKRPLLDALEDHGVHPEAACRSGECSLCRVRVLSGDVFNAQEARRRMSDASFGYIHSCVAYPITDVEIAL